MKKLWLWLLAASCASRFVTVSGLAEADSLVRIFTASGSHDDLPANAMEKVQRMVDRLIVKINNETKLNTEMNKKYKKWCVKSMHTAEQEIKYHQQFADKYYAILLQTSADVKQAQEEIDRLFTELTVTQTQLKRATESRAKEAADYAQNKADLEESLVAVNKAITILSAEMAKNPAFMQKIDNRTVDALLQTFSTAMDAVSIPMNDKQRLMALIQSQHVQAEQEEDEDDDQQEPKLAKSPYTSRSGDIVETLEDMKQQAIVQLRKMEDDEIKAQGDYQLLKQSLEAEIAEEQQALEENKKKKGEALKEHAAAEREYNKAKSDIDHNKQILKDHEKDCADQEKDYQRFLVEQAKEIDILNKAKAMLDDSSGHLGGVQDMTEGGDFTGNLNVQYSMLEDIQPSASSISLLQESTVHMNRVSAKLVGMVRKLAHKHRNLALAQLASQMKSLLRYADDDADPFLKVKNLIKDMISKLEGELSEQQKEMEYCDNEMNQTKKKLEELGIDIEKLDRLHELSYMKEVDLKSWLQAIRDAIAEEAREREEFEMLFNNESRKYYNTLAELQDALQALQQAIQLLTEFYGEPPREESEVSEGSEGSEVSVNPESLHEVMEIDSKPQHERTMEAVNTKSDSEGAEFVQLNSKVKKRKFMQGHGIIEMLEIIEADIQESIRLENEMLGKLRIRHHEVLHDYLVSRELKEKDTEYGEKDLTHQHVETGHVEEDEEVRLTEKEELAVYYLNLRDRCITRPEDQRDRTRARADEIAGLKEALNVLYTETQWIQESSRDRKSVV